MQDAVKVMAKSLVRNRHAVTKMYGLKSQLQAVSLRIQVGLSKQLLLVRTQHCSSGLTMPCLMQTLKSTQAMADAMRGATKVQTYCKALAMCLTMRFSACLPTEVFTSHGSLCSLVIICRHPVNSTPSFSPLHACFPCMSVLHVLLLR